MRKIILAISLLYFSIPSIAQSPNTGEISLEIRYHSYLGDLIDTSIILSEGGNIWSLMEYGLYDSTNNLVRKTTYWNGGFSFFGAQNFSNLPFGKYLIRPNYYELPDTFHLSKENPSIQHTIYWNKKSLIDTTNSFVEQMKNGDTMTMNVIRHTANETNKSIIITKKNDQYNLVLKTKNEDYSKVLTKKDLVIIKSFEWDAKLDFSYRDCNDILTLYYIKWNEQERKVWDSCNLWGGVEMLKYLLFGVE